MLLLFIYDISLINTAGYSVHMSFHLKKIESIICMAVDSNKEKSNFECSSVSCTKISLNWTQIAWNYRILFQNSQLSALRNLYWKESNEFIQSVKSQSQCVYGTSGSKNFHECQLSRWEYISLCWSTFAKTTFANIILFRPYFIFSNSNVNIKKYPFV